MKLSKKDRLILYNQYEILKHLCQKDEYQVAYYNTKQDILLNGYVYEYPRLIEGFDKEVPEALSQFVKDVLQMYRTLEDSYSKLSGEEKGAIEPSNLRFRGFDGNEEAEYWSYCTFLTETLKLFSERKADGNTNSHFPMVEKYKEMLERWKEIQSNPYAVLTKAQILKIIQK